MTTSAQLAFSRETIDELVERRQEPDWLRQIRLAAFDERFADENWQISDVRIRLANELTQAEIKLAENLAQIVEVAGQIYAEHAASELLRLREDAPTAELATV